MEKSPVMTQGCVCARLHNRQNGLAGLAWIGSRFVKRARSSASDSAEGYRRSGRFSRHVRQIVSRSAGVCGRSRDGGSGGVSSVMRNASMAVEA